MTEAEFRALKSGDVIALVERPDLHRTVSGTPNSRGEVFLTNGGWAKDWRLWAKVEPEPSNHYVTGQVPETWEIIEAWQKTWPADIRYHLGNVTKYLSRLGRKPGAGIQDDLDKLIHYAQRAKLVLGQKQ